MAVWWAVSFLLMGVDPERYRLVAQEAARDGTLASQHQLLFAPDKTIYLYGDNDCLILGMLAMPRESRLKASLSPRMPPSAERTDFAVDRGFPPTVLCASLALTLDLLGRDQPVPQLANAPYYHRYIHGDALVAALLLRILPFKAASAALLAVCYGLLGTLMLAALREPVSDPTDRRRGSAFLAIAISLLAFYALPIFGWSFSFAPTDAAVIGFILFGLLRPLGRIPESHLVMAAACFGSLIAILEFFTGGIPIALAALIALIALGAAPDRKTLLRRLVLGPAAFMAGVLVCFACKQVAVACVWGMGTIADFANVLGSRISDPAAGLVPASVRDYLVAIGIDPSMIDSNYFTRAAFAAVIVIYAAFVLGWGSHVLGGAIAVLPVVLLPVLAYQSVRKRRAGEWPLELLAIGAAGMVPIAWYAVFVQHTINHPLWMVRPLALNVGLLAAAWLYRPKPARTATDDPRPAA